MCMAVRALDCSHGHSGREESRGNLKDETQDILYWYLKGISDVELQDGNPEMQRSPAISELFPVKMMIGNPNTTQWGQLNWRSQTEACRLAPGP